MQFFTHKLSQTINIIASSGLITIKSSEGVFPTTDEPNKYLLFVYLRIYSIVLGIPVSPKISFLTPLHSFVTSIKK